jgi:mannose-6-phosphate isomerase-like protein (cupin superfamily)
LDGAVEFFHVVEGTGALWLEAAGDEQVVDLSPGRSAVIPEGVCFQYRADDDVLRFLVATMPRWRPDLWSPGPIRRWKEDGSDARDKAKARDPRDAPWAVADLPAEPLAVAPDGSDVRPLVRAADGRGSLARFTLKSGTTSKAARHFDLEEIWFFLSGSGEMWREGGDPVAVGANTALTIPARVSFQFRSSTDDALEIVGLTLPAWPLDRPEYEVVDTAVDGWWKS